MWTWKECGAECKSSDGRWTGNRTAGSRSKAATRRRAIRNRVQIVDRSTDHCRLSIHSDANALYLSTYSNIQCLPHSTNRSTSAPVLDCSSSPGRSCNLVCIRSQRDYFFTGNFLTSHSANASAIFSGHSYKHQCPASITFSS